jgi:uroporphyrinogen-III decarboxylase
MEKSSEELYEERERRTQQAIELKVPDRVPVMSLFGFFPARYAGITFEEAMYDYDKMMKAWVAAMAEFQPDMYENPFTIRYLGPVMEALDYKQLKWPGHGCSPMSTYQYVEGEYMKAEDYDDFLFDLSDFMVRRYWPRIFGALQPLKNLPPLNSIITYYMGLAAFSAFDGPEIRKAIEAVQKAAAHAQRLLAGAAEYAAKMKALGFPPQFGSLSQAPFDTLSDFFRGTKGAMLDMFRYPDKILEAAEKLLPIMIRVGLAAKTRGVSRVFIPLHKGLDGFMSPTQFKTFYWPTLRRLVLAFIEQGLNPVLLWEGDCTSRLELIGDIPPGKAVYWFERTDIFRAKEILGKVTCLRGNVPLSLMCTGTPDDVKRYCKKLIDVVGKGGGFIMDCSTVVDDAKPENLRTLIDFTKEYGVYR